MAAEMPPGEPSTTKDQDESIFPESHKTNDEAPHEDPSDNFATQSPPAENHPMEQAITSRSPVTAVVPDDDVEGGGSYLDEYMYENEKQRSYGPDWRIISTIQDDIKKPLLLRKNYINALEDKVITLAQNVKALEAEREAFIEELNQLRLNKTVEEVPGSDSESTGHCDVVPTVRNDNEGDDNEKETSQAVALMSWATWAADPGRGRRPQVGVVEALVESPRIYRTFYGSAAFRRHRKETSSASRTTVERIRINSLHLHEVFKSILGDCAPEDHTILLKPFKLLVHYNGKLQRLLEKAQRDLQVQPEVHRDVDDEDEHNDHAVDVEEDMGSERYAQHMDPMIGNDDAASLSSDRDPAIGENLSVTPGIIFDLQILLDFTGTHLKDHLDIHHQLRTRERSKVSFKDLWHLFAPGDIVYDASAKQAFQVVAVHGGRPLLSKPPEDPANSSFQAYFARFSLGAAEESIVPFVIECFHLDFDGEELGPISHCVEIMPYDGEHNVQSLKIYPIEYGRGKTGATEMLAEDTVEKRLIKRGEKFVQFTDSRQVAHREYIGFSVGNVREQIDSRVIMDISLYYELQPDAKPVLGLNPPSEQDKGETTEMHTCYCIECLGQGGRNTHIYDDGHVDRQRVEEFMSQNSRTWRHTRARNTRFTDDQLLLLPSKAYGYVLRSRKWYQLDVEKITEVEPRPQNFEDLILPPKYKTLVEGMVKTHARIMKTDNPADEQPTECLGSDLVRGKGKGVIILLHGVPGVGKTSTAECVAEYTMRPLFSITCGDIGENANQVEESLEQSFQLAHRWGCVLLLDEADVFLQSRNRQDMKRNAVVSVFLRILEYYSGILFLTTNKVGTFDEAFKSRIHLSLYYPPLDFEQTNAIWKVNLDRIRMSKPNLRVDQDGILVWVNRLIFAMERRRLRPWNGRQIHNACQTATAIALFENKGELLVNHFQTVADASMEFDKYMTNVHGTDDSGRAKNAQDRFDDFDDVDDANYSRGPKMPGANIHVPNMQRDFYSANEPDDGFARGARAQGGAMNFGRGTEGENMNPYSHARRQDQYGFDTGFNQPQGGMDGPPYSGSSMSGAAPSRHDYRESHMSRGGGYGNAPPRRHNTFDE